jgi:hypothetical protein
MRKASSGFFAAMLFGLMTSAVMADSAETPPAPAGSDTSSDPTTVKPDDSKIVVCHVSLPPTGSHMGGDRVCKTKAEWDRENRDSQDYLRRADQVQLNGGTGGH